ncbi:MAG: peroxidase family protein [Chthoniobacterales bacterium]
MNPPYEPAPRDRYCRLFPSANPSFDLGIMQKLGASMEASETRIPSEQLRHPLPAGYTYFGQLVDHDLTLDETPLNLAINYASLPVATENAADGRFNLNHLYGAGPGSVQHGSLYETDGCSFRLGTVRSKSGETFDLPLGKEGPEAAESRNTGNLILRQLCVMFLKLHNLAVQGLPATLDPWERFNRARNRVCWQYQWLVREDYLYQVITHDVYDQVVPHSRHTVDWLGKGFAMPVEFSQAAFRFGHSMVREKYTLNLDNRGVPLRAIFDPRLGDKPLDPGMAIDWARFLDMSESSLTGRNRVPAMAIDTTMVPPLFHLPREKVHHFTEADAPDLPGALAVRTLLRGASTRLATGEGVTRAMGFVPLQDRGLPGGSASWKKLDELGLKGRTPLWYYLLLEAEMECGGVCLGTVGSQLVAEVVDGCLHSDGASYLSCFGSSWQPAPWKMLDGTMKSIRRLLDLARVTGLAVTP